MGAIEAIVARADHGCFKTMPGNHWYWWPTAMVV
jgi:hypothetical protein